MDDWYKLNSIGKLYAAIKSGSNTSVFRLSVVLKEDVSFTSLVKALEIIKSRYPMFFVKLKKGIFWNYLEKSDDEIIVEKDYIFPNSTMFSSDGNNDLIRILYFKRRISVEFFHSLADGYGAFTFLKSLIFYYIKDKYDNEIDDENLIVLAKSEINKYETEDSFLKYSKGVYYEPINSKKAFLLKGTKFKEKGHNITSLVVSVSDLKKVSQKYDTTINSYLAALLLYSIYETEGVYNKLNKPIVVSIPVNLRNTFPSKTLRNFFTIINVGIIFDRDYDFIEIIKHVKETVKHKTNKLYLQNGICSNVALEEMVTSKYVPLFIKKWFMKYGFDSFGSSKKTITLTNTGEVILPEAFSKYIEMTETNLYTTKLNPVGVAISSYQDKLVISFTRDIKEKDFISFFSTYLTREEKLNIDIYSNDWGN